MSRPALQMDDAQHIIAPDEQIITLDKACAMFFADAIRPASLRAEAKRGNLAVFSVGRTHFTTAGPSAR